MLHNLLFEDLSILDVPKLYSVGIQSVQRVLREVKKDPKYILYQPRKRIESKKIKGLTGVVHHRKLRSQGDDGITWNIQQMFYNIYWTNIKIHNYQSVKRANSDSVHQNSECFATCKHQH
jgi:hypothetical protein